MAARDNMLRKHPNLRYVGLHLFSMEFNLDEVAKRLNEFLNLKTDLAERICHVQLQSIENIEKVREFFLKYQGRVIYGTDVKDDGSMTEDELNDKFKNLWQAHWDFFATSKELTASEFEGDFRGLDLPQEVVEKIFCENGRETYGFNLS